MIHEVPRSIEVKGGGLGIALINVDVFSKLQYPYFKFVTYPNETVEVLDDKVEDILTYVGLIN